MSIPINDLACDSTTSRPSTRVCRCTSGARGGHGGNLGLWAYQIPLRIFMMVSLDPLMRKVGKSRRLVGNNKPGIAQMTRRRTQLRTYA